MGEARRRGSFEERADAAIKKQEEIIQENKISPHMGTYIHGPAAMMLMMAAAIGGTWADKYPRPSRRSRRGY